LKKPFHKIARTGITSETSFDFRNKLTVLNNANILIFLVSVFYAGIGFYNGFYLAVVLTFFSFFSTILGFILIAKGHYKFVFHYMMVYAIVFLSSFSYFFGGVNNSHYYFLFLPVACNILFNDLKTNVFYLCLGILIMLANVAFIDHFEPYYKVDGDLKYFGYPNVLFVSLLIYLGVSLFKQENNKYAATIEEQRKILEEKNHEITDSINYAKKIQEALIPAETEFTTYFKEAFVLLKPKDIVSGDFYWVTKKQNKVFYATADCTGHGVPGGFMTMLGISFLDEIVNEKNIIEPNEILNTLRERIISTLKQTGTAGESKDGMDIALCCLDTDTNTLTYAAANNSVYVLSKEKLSPVGEMPKAEGVFTEYKPDKQPCGFHHEPKPFTKHEIKLQPGDTIYTFSDGYADQFGGEKGKKFKYKKLEELLVRSNNDFKAQKKLLDTTFDAWKGNLEQVDDILLIGIRI